MRAANWLKWFAAAGLLVALFFSQRNSILSLGPGPKAWGYLVLGLVILLVTYLVTFLRWWLLVRALRFVFSPQQALRLGFIGLISNFLTPGALGGDFVKAFLIGRDHPQRRTVAVATVVLDRMMGLVALFVVGGLASLVPSAMLAHTSMAPVRWLMWSGSLFGLASLAIVLQPAFSHWQLWQTLRGLPLVGGLLHELLGGIRLYQSNSGVIWISLGLALLCQIGLICGFYACALWIDGAWAPDLLTHFFMLPTAQLFAAFIPLPAGTGALEGAMQWFYTQVRPAEVTTEMAGAAGFLAALAFRLVTMVIAALGGGYYLMSRQEIARATEPGQTPHA
jgi:glycosyltransferase 2 family protein